MFSNATVTASTMEKVSAPKNNCERFPVLFVIQILIKVHVHTFLVPESVYPLPSRSIYQEKKRVMMQIAKDGSGKQNMDKMLRRIVLPKDRGLRNLYRGRVEPMSLERKKKVMKKQRRGKESSSRKMRSIVSRPEAEL
jgi:hypothetical protein